jgi:transposase
MARSLSNDLRERVVARVAAGETVRAVAAVFGVSVSSVVKWSQRWRATGSAAACSMGGKRRDAMALGREFALARLAEQPSLPLRALPAELAARGVRVSYGALWTFCHAEGLSFKKRPSSQPRRSVPTLPAAAPAGSAISTVSTPSGLCSLTKPG